ncbi:MAG: LysR substrate-binding domain-containing protein, partial [Burkholderiales bacterium]
QELRARKLDLVIGRIPLRPAPEDLSIEIPFDEPIFVVAGTGNHWARRRQMVLADLVDEPWVLPPQGSAIGSYIAEAFRASSLDYPGRVAVSSSLQFTYALVATGRYLGTFPGSLLHFGGKRYALKVLPITLPGDPPPVSMVTLKNRTLAPAAKLFIDCIRGIAKSLATRSKRPLR